MSVIRDLVVADPSDAKKIWEDIKLKGFTWVETPNLTIVMLGALLCVLGKRRFSKKLFDDFPILIDDGTAVTKISDDLVALLAEVKEGSIPEIAVLWASKLEKAGNAGLIGPWDTLEGIAVDRVEQRLLDLRRLSKDAMSRKKSLLLRECP